MTDMNRISEQELENIAGGSEYTCDSFWRTAIRFRSQELMCRAQASEAAQPPTYGYLRRSSVFPDT